MNVTTTCTKCGWSQFAQVTTVSTRITGEMEIMLSGKALLDDYKRLLLENRNLKERVAELEAEQARWVMVSERLPQIGMRVLFYNNFIKNIHKGWYSGDEWVSEIGVFYNGDKLKRITHWMPLPQPPEVQRQ